MASLLDKTNFESFYSMVRLDIMQEIADMNVSDSTYNRMQESFDYNVKQGKLFQSRIVPHTAQYLLGRELTAHEIMEASILGWLLSFFRGCLHVFDDIEDRSLTRRGIPCWHTLPGVDEEAINDACLLRSVIYVLLKKHFRSHPRYIDMVELFNDVLFRTEVGQEMDLLSGKESDPANWNIEDYNTMASLKCQYAAYYQPVVLTLCYLDLSSPLNISQTQQILFPLGHFFQVQNDMLDIYGDANITGKIGTDILENKCSWVIIHLLPMCTETEQAYLRQHYGKCGPNGVDAVKDIMLAHRCEMMATYALEEEALSKRLAGVIQRMDESAGLKKAIFERLVDNMKMHTKALY